jgi:trigger factor
VNPTIKEVSPTRRSIDVEFSVEDILKEEEGLLKEFSQQAKIPGFRPGKAPLNLIRSKYKKAIQDELSRKVVTNAYKAGVSDNKDLKVYSVADIRGGDAIKAGEGVTITIEVDIVPEFATPAFRSFTVPEEAVVVGDEEIEAEIGRIRRSRADYKIVGKEAEVGNFVRLDYEGTLDGKPVSELVDQPIYGKQSGTWEQAGEAPQGMGIPSVVNGIIGMKAGDTKTVTETFAEDFAVEALRGKSVDYAITVAEVREVVEPEINEEFLKSLGVETEEALREQLRENILNQKKSQADMKVREQVLDQLRAAVDFPLPEAALNHQTQETLTRMMQSNMQQGVAEEELRQNQERLFEAAEETAKRNLKTDLILQQIAEEEKVEVTNEDLSRAVMSEAYRARMDANELVKRLKDDRDLLNNFRQRVLFGKTLDVIVGAVSKVPA